MLVKKHLRRDSTGTTFLALGNLYSGLLLTSLQLPLRIVGKTLHHRTLMR